MQSPMIFGQPQGQQSRNQFVNDVSEADYSGQMGYVAGKGGLNIQFFYARIRLDDPVNPTEHGKYVTRLCVAKQPIGDRHTIATRMIDEQTAMRLFPREYAHFKQNEEVPTDGTPLHELPGITQSQIAILIIHAVRCIEDLVGMSPDRINSIGMDAVSAYALAKKWTETRTANGEIIRDAEKDAATSVELARLRASEVQNAQVIAQLSAKLDILTQMGISTGTGQQGSISGSQNATMVDADDIPDPVADVLFTGASTVTGGNEDLDDDGPTQADPLGLIKKRK